MCTYYNVWTQKISLLVITKIIEKLRNDWNCQKRSRIRCCEQASKFACCELGKMLNRMLQLVGQVSGRPKRSLLCLQSRETGKETSKNQLRKRHYHHHLVQQHLLKDRSIVLSFFSKNNVFFFSFFLSFSIK